MQVKIFATLAALACSANAQTITNTNTPNASQFSKISSEWNTYTATAFGALASADVALSLYAVDGAPDPTVASIARSILSRASLPTLAQSDWSDVVNFVNYVATVSVPPAVPTEIYKPYKDLATAAVSVINKDMAGAASSSALDRTVLMTGITVAGAVAAVLLL